MRSIITLYLLLAVCFHFRCDLCVYIVCLFVVIPCIFSATQRKQKIVNVSPVVFAWVIKSKIRFGLKM